MHRSPTFLVGTRQQRVNLSEFHKEERETVEASWLRKNVPLCFQAETYQKTHPAKTLLSASDADACLVSPMMVGVLDGVSQLEEFGIDPAELPQELCRACEELAYHQLVPEPTPDDKPKEQYKGPVSLLADAYMATEALGSTTVLLCALDNMTKVHGRTHPMIACLSIGDCELLLLRRNVQTDDHRLELIFHTEMQRIAGNKQAPLQVARVDDRIDEDFDEDIALEVIQDGSAVHCFTAQEGDVVVMGSDGVFDNLFSAEIVEILNGEFEEPDVNSQKFAPQSSECLQKVCKRIVECAHAKSGPDGKNRWSSTPIGYGGKIDDTSCVVAEVVEYTQLHCNWHRSARRARKIKSCLNYFGKTCGPLVAPCRGTASIPKQHVIEEEEEEEVEQFHQKATTSGYQTGYSTASPSEFTHPFHGQSTYFTPGINQFDNVGQASEEEEEEDEDDRKRCSVM